MPFTTSELRDATTVEQRTAISDAIHTAMIEVLGIPEDDRFHVFHERRRCRVPHPRNGPRELVGLGAGREPADRLRPAHDQQRVDVELTPRHAARGSSQQSKGSPDAP